MIELNGNMGQTFTRYEPDRHVMPLAAADSMRGVAASKDSWPRDTQWRGWCATGHESASWWPLFVVEWRQEYIEHLSKMADVHLWRGDHN